MSSRDEAAYKALQKERQEIGVRIAEADADPGTRNYVVFDERLITILRKYGLLPPAAHHTPKTAKGRLHPSLPARCARCWLVTEDVKLRYAGN